MERTNPIKDLDRIDRVLSKVVQHNSYLFTGVINNKQSLGSCDKLKLLFDSLFGRLLNIKSNTSNYIFKFNEQSKYGFIEIIKMVTEKILKITINDKKLLYKYKATQDYIERITINLNEISNRFKKNQNVTSWSDLKGRLVALAPSVVWSWKSPSSWLTLISASPASFLKGISLIRACGKTFLCWFSEDYKDNADQKTEQVQNRFNEFNDLVSPWLEEWKLFKDYEKNLEIYKKTPSNKLLIEIIKTNISLKKSNKIPKEMIEALEEEKGLRLSDKNELLKLFLQNPLTPNLGALISDNNTSVLNILSSNALDKTISPLQRRHFLCALVERLIANQLLGIPKFDTPEFPLKKHLPTDLINLIGMAKDLYTSKDIKIYFKESEKLPTFSENNITYSHVTFGKTKKSFDAPFKAKLHTCDKIFTNLINDPRCPNLFALEQKGIKSEHCVQLSTLAMDKNITPAQRAYFLGNLLEISIAQELYGQASLPEFALKKHLPKTLKERIELLKRVYENQTLDHLLINKTENIPSFNPSVVNIIVPESKEKAIYDENQKVFQNEEGLFKTSCLSMDSSCMKSFVEKVLNDEKCLGNKEIVVNRDLTDSLWENLLLLAQHGKVSHIYLQGKGTVSVPSENILMDKSLKNLMHKMRVSEPLCFNVEKDKTKAFMLKLLTALCPGITLQKDNEDIVDYSKCSILECTLLLKEAAKSKKLPEKVIMPTSMSMQDLAWCIENKLLSSISYLDIRECKNLDATILSNPFFTPSFGKKISIRFPDCFKVHNIDVLAKLKPFTDDPAKMRDWLFPKDDTIFGRDIWLPYLDKLYNGPWEYASVFLIPAAKTKKLDFQLLKSWTILDPCSVALWLHDDSYKLIGKINHIKEVNAYGNGLLNDDNVEGFLEKFPNIRTSVCATGTNVCKYDEIASQYYRSSKHCYIKGVEPEPTYCLNKETAVEKYKSSKSIQQQNCQLFIETFCPEKMTKFSESIPEFKNFQIEFNGITWGFNLFALAKNNSCWKYINGLNSTDFCTLNFNNPKLTLPIVTIILSHLENEKEEIPELPSFKKNGNLEEYKDYILNLQYLLELSEAFDLKKLRNDTLPPLIKLKLKELDSTASTLGNEAFKQNKELFNKLNSSPNFANSLSFLQLKS